MGAGDVVFGEGLPNFSTFFGTSKVTIGLSFDFVEDGGMDGIKGVERFGIELDRWQSIAAVWSDFWHIGSYKILELSWIKLF